MPDKVGHLAEGLGAPLEVTGVGLQAIVDTCMFLQAGVLGEGLLADRTAYQLVNMVMAQESKSTKM